MESDALLSRSANFISRNLGDELVLVPINQTGADVQKIYSLNETAAAVWGKIATPLSVDELLADIENEFSGDRSVIREEFEKLLEEFIQAGFVKIKER